MVEQVLDACVKEDSARARKIAFEDHGINDFSSRIYKECIRQMQENPGNRSRINGLYAGFVLS